MGARSRIKRIIQKMRIVEKVPVYIPRIEGHFLEGKTVLITGGNRGIGFTIAQACVRNGATVIITGRNEGQLKEACGQLKQYITYGGQKVAFGVLDLTSVSSIRSNIDKLLELHEIKSVDAFVNNAGIDAGGHLGKTTEEQFDKVIETNLKGTYFMSQEAMNYLIENRIEGNILNVSSVSGIRPVNSPYMLSKRGIDGITYGLAKKAIKYNIVVNGIAPGPTATEMLGLDGTNLSYGNAPAKRYCDPTEIGNLAVVLLSDIGRMIVGDTVYISGGCGNLTVDDIVY